MLFGQLCDHRGDEATIREEAAFLLGVEVGRQVGVTSEPVSTTAADEPASVIRRDADGHVVPFTPEELLEARRPTLEDVLNEAIGALRLAQTVSQLTSYANGEYILPAETGRVLGEVTEEAADHLTRLHRALPGRLMVTAVEDVASESGGAR